MKPYAIFIFVMLFLMHIQCKKDKETSTLPAPVNCDGLLTDSAGIKDSTRVFIPGVFTPNGDSYNDKYGPVMLYIQSYDFTIYDDRNNIMFHTTTQGEYWDGKNVSGNVNRYFYRLQVITSNNGKRGYCGEFYCLRCLPDDIDKNKLKFPDQIHPGYGFVFPTQDPLQRCQ